VFSFLAGTAIKIPQLFGLSINDSVYGLIYLKNLSFFILPFIAAFFLIKHQSTWKMSAAIMNHGDLRFGRDTD